MRILLVANYLPDAQESMQRFAALLGTGFAHAGHTVRTLRPSVIAGCVARNDSAAKWLGYVDKFALFPRVLREAAAWAQIVHVCDHSNAFYMKYLAGRPHVVTCHDLLAVRSAIGDIPRRETRWSGRRLQSMILTGLGRARHIVCVSDSTRHDVLRIVPDAARQHNKITRIYNGLNYPYAPMDRGQAEGRLTRLGLSPRRPFLLHVGGNQWYKNRPGVIDIFARLRTLEDGRDLALVMAGKPWTAELRQLILSRKLESSAVELSNVPEEDLRALYSSAELMLFPSLAEGFGWPVIEAQACGCIVAASNFAPMTEVGGDAAIYVDPADPESAALKLWKVLRSAPGLRVALRQAGLRNAARFSAASMIGAYLNLYQGLTEGEPASPPRVYASAG